MLVPNQGVIPKFSWKYRGTLRIILEENRIRNLANKRPERYHYTKLHGLLLMTLEERHL